MRASQTRHFVLLIDWSAGAARRRSDAKTAIERAGGSVAPVTYTHRSDYRLALEFGKGVTEYQPFEPAANEIRSIWTWLRNELAITVTDADARAAVA
jgi:chromosome partitioning protein